MNAEINLFNEPIQASQKARAKTLAEKTHSGLIALYGKIEGKACRQCQNCQKKHYYAKAYVCGLMKRQTGPGTDWRVKWPACGKFQERGHNGKA
jgi:hypothetical protein